MRSARNLAAIALTTIGILAGPSIALAAGPASPTSKIPPPPSAAVPELSTVRLSATDVVGGSSVTGTVALTSAARTGGLLVALSSDNPDAATVPASVTVPAGVTSVSFLVSTKVLGNSQSSNIIANAGTVTTYTIITVRTQFQFSNGSVSIVPGNNGSGTVTSSPAGISCNLGADAAGNASGTCSAFFPVGTVVKLTARAAANSSFQGFRGTPGCSDPSKIIVARGTTITCQPAFTLK